MRNFGMNSIVHGEKLMLLLVFVSLAMLLCGLASFYVLYHFLRGEENNDRAEIHELISSDKPER